MPSFFRDPDSLSGGSVFINPDYEAGGASLTDPAASATGTTTASASVAYSGSSGTLWIYVSTSPTEPNVTEHKDGTGAAFWEQVAATQGTNTFSISGLSENTLYYAHFLGNDGSEDTNLAEANFTTQALGIVSINSGADITDGQTAVEVAFNGVATTITSLTINTVAQSNIQTSVGGDDFLISFDAVWPASSGSNYGAVLPVVANSSYVSSATIIPSSGYGYIQLSSYSATGSGDLATAIPDLENGDSIEFELFDSNVNSVSIDAAGYPIWSVSSVNDAGIFQARAIDPDDGTRSAWVNISYNAAANAAPTITGDASHTVNEGVAFTYDYVIANMDGELPTLSGSDAGLFTLSLVSGNTWRLGLTAKDFGAPVDANTNNVYEVTINANDTINPVVTLAVTVTVQQVTSNDPPVITGSTSHTINEGSAFTANYTITNMDGQTPTLSGTDSALFSISLVTGNTWRLSLSAQDFDNPADGDGDNVYEVTIVADDGVNTAVTLAVFVTVSEVVVTPGDPTVIDIDLYKIVLRG